jgi:HPt (histidine-containing phosphotransfer) domain-containing protein
MNDDRVIDEALLDGIRDIMDDAFPELIESFVEETSALFQEILQAAEVADHDRVSRLAHSIKSSSATIGALRLSKSARSLEIESRGGKTDPELLGRMRREVEAACDELRLMT